MTVLKFWFWCKITQFFDRYAEITSFCGTCGPCGRKSSFGHMIGNFFWGIWGENNRLWPKFRVPQALWCDGVCSSRHMCEWSSLAFRDIYLPSEYNMFGQVCILKSMKEGSPPPCGLSKNWMVLFLWPGPHADIGTLLSRSTAPSKWIRHEFIWYMIL
jgi:hypothetical protein